MTATPSRDTGRGKGHPALSSATLSMEATSPRRGARGQHPPERSSPPSWLCCAQRGPDELRCRVDVPADAAGRDPQDALPALPERPVPGRVLVTARLMSAAGLHDDEAGR